MVIDPAIDCFFFFVNTISYYHRAQKRQPESNISMHVHAGLLLTLGLVASHSVTLGVCSLKLLYLAFVSGQLVETALRHFPDVTDSQTEFYLAVNCFRQKC